MQQSCSDAACGRTPVATATSFRRRGGPWNAARSALARPQAIGCRGCSGLWGGGQCVLVGASRHARRLVHQDKPIRLLHIGGISNSGLHELLTELRRTTSLPSTSRRAIEASFSRRFDGLKLVRPMPFAERSGVFNWEFLDPNMLIAESVAESALLRQSFENALSETPSSLSRPWRLVIGFDEYAPGNKFKAKPPSKEQAPLGLLIVDQRKANQKPDVANLGCFRLWRCPWLGWAWPLWLDHIVVIQVAAPSLLVCTISGPEASW